MPAFYFHRAQRNVVYCQKHRPIQPSEKIVELGTGWVHWEALTLRLFFDFEAVLYDVWDNRQLSALKSWVRQLEGKFGEKGFLEGCDFDRARAIIKKIQAVNSFDELYDLLGFRYICDPSGLMECLPRESFGVAISAGVMEHIPGSTAPQFVNNMASLLVKGGLGIHGINISDHLSFHDPSASPKEYLSYSKERWKFWCENDVQYINRIQRSSWLRMFDQAGFTLLEEDLSKVNVNGLRIHPDYRDLSKEDIECTTLVVVVRKA